MAKCKALTGSAVKGLTRSLGHQFGKASSTKMCKGYDMQFNPHLRQCITLLTILLHLSMMMAGRPASNDFYRMITIYLYTHVLSTFSMPGWYPMPNEQLRS